MYLQYTIFPISATTSKLIFYVCLCTTIILAIPNSVWSCNWQWWDSSWSWKCCSLQESEWKFLKYLFLLSSCLLFIHWGHVYAISKNARIVIAFFFSFFKFFSIYSIAFQFRQYYRDKDCFCNIRSLKTLDWWLEDAKQMVHDTERGKWKLPLYHMNCLFVFCACVDEDFCSVPPKIDPLIVLLGRKFRRLYEGKMKSIWWITNSY